MRRIGTHAMKITIALRLSVLISGRRPARRDAPNQEIVSTLKHVLTISAMVALAIGHALAGGMKVIANPSVKVYSISASELRSVFLEDKSSLAGSHVEPVLARGGPAHDAFLQIYMGRTDSDLQTYYRSLVFTGRGFMPRAFGSDAEVVAYVANTRGAVGYVSSDCSVEGIRILAVVNSETSERKLIVRVEPDYPELLRSRSIGGTVRLRVTIAPSGNITHVEVRGGDAALGEAAAQAVAKWKYSGARSDSVTEISITFDPKVGTR